MSGSSVLERLQLLPERFRRVAAQGMPGFSGGHFVANWHTHPEGQILHVLAGTGRAATESGPVTEINTGDVVYFAPGEKHCHGAAPDAFMVHLAINPAANSDGGTGWQEPVSGEQYGGTANQSRPRNHVPPGRGVRLISR